MTAGRTASQRGSLTAVFSAGFLGGSELFNLEYLRQVRSHGVAIDAVVPEEGPVADALRPLARSVVTAEVPAALRELSRFDTAIDTGAMMRRLSAALAHARRLRTAIRGTAGPICCFGFRAQLALGVQPAIGSRPVVWVIHEVVPASPFGRIWGVASARPATVLAYSPTAAKQPLLLRRASVEVVEPSLDLEGFAAQPPPEHPPKRLVLVGDLVPLKNHGGFIDLVERLRAGGLKVDGLIVGRRNDSRPDLSAYGESVIARAGAPGSAVSVTECHPAEMPALLGKADLLLHLSTVPESFGRVCVEAMAAGRPVVAFDHGAVGEVVEHERTGLLTGAGDLDGAAQAVERLSAEPELYRALCTRAATTAQERFGARSGRPTIGSALADLAEGAFVR